MPKSWSDEERLAIRAKLMDVGREHFVQYGLRKTNVSELSKAAGIAKGSFYLFFDSKEELLMEILEALEKDFRASMVKDLLDAEGEPDALFRAFLHKQFELFERVPLIKIATDQEAITQLVRKLPAERILEHQQGDDVFLIGFVEELQKKGFLKKRNPRGVAGLLKLGLVMSMQKALIGEDLFPDVVELFIEIVVDALCEGGEMSDGGGGEP